MHRNFGESVDTRTHQRKNKRFAKLMLSNCLVVVVVVVICFCYFIHFAHFIHASQAGKQVFPKQLFARKVLPTHEYVIYIDKNAHIHNYTHTYAHVKQLIAIQRKFRHRTSTIYHWHDS